MADESPITPGVKIPATDTASVTSGTSVADDVKRVDSSGRKRARSRKRDAPPKSAAKPRATEAVSSFTNAELQQALTEILTFPAMPAGMMGDEWAVNHFLTTGPNLAEQLVKQADKSPAVRKWCERIASGEAMGTLAFSVFMYAVPPLVHWGLVPLPGNARGMIPGMPPAETAATEATAAQHMAPEPDNSSNGNNTGTRTQRHTP